MAIQRSTVDDLVTEIRRNIGEPTASRSHVTDAQIYKLMNRYLQKLAHRLSDAMRAEGIRIGDGGLHFDMWRTTWESTTNNQADAFVVAAGSSNAYLPTNYDHCLSFFDKTHDRELFVVHDVQSNPAKIADLKNLSPGPPQAIQIKGYVTNATYWVRQCRLYPDVPSGFTPSLTLEGWRLPAQVTASSDYPDIDPKYEELLVIGLTTMILRKDDPNYNRFSEEERILLMNMASTVRAA